MPRPGRLAGANLLSELRAHVEGSALPLRVLRRHHPALRRRRSQMSPGENRDKFNTGAASRRHHRGGKCLITNRVKLQKLQTESREGRIPENPSRLALAEYLDHWIANVVTLERSNGTARIYTRAADYVRPFIGGVRLLDLRRAHVEDLVLQLRRLPRIEIVERF